MLNSLYVPRHFVKQVNKFFFLIQLLQSGSVASRTCIPIILQSVGASCLSRGSVPAFL